MPAVMLVVDGSGSMDEPAGDGRTRMEAAEDAINAAMAAVPDGTQVGLRVFGGERRGEESCADTRLEVPVGAVDRPAINAALDGLEPRGRTPLADSIEAAAAELPDDIPGMIIVVTDGEENCGGDPCEIAGQVTQAGVELRVDVVGFQVPADEQRQLECIADAGGGTFFEAEDADGLAAQLRRAAVRGLRVFIPSGIPVEGTTTAQGAPAIEQGRYLDELLGDQPRHYSVDVPEGQTLWAAATTTTNLASLTATADLELTIASASGSRCESDTGTVVGASGRGMPLTAAVMVAAEDLADCGAGPHVVSVVQGRGGENTDRAVEVLIGLEPAVATLDGLPSAADDQSWEVEPAQTGSPEQVIGSPNIASATLVEPGTYSDTILVSETLYYAVELDWGQQLVCEATIGADSAVASGLSGAPPAARTHMFAPFRAELSGPRYEGGGDLYDATEDVTHTSTTPPVRYLNREVRQPRPASLAGTYYCAVKLAGNPGDAGVGEIPVHLAIDVVGQAEGEPDYLMDEEDLEPDPGAAEDPDPGSEADEPEAAAPSDGLPTWAAFAGVFVLGVLLTTGMAYLLTQRRRGETRDT
jgi:Ca-activated chloride channel family protein